MFKKTAKTTKLSKFKKIETKTLSKVMGGWSFPTVTTPAPAPPLGGLGDLDSNAHA